MKIAWWQQLKNELMSNLNCLRHLFGLHPFSHDGTKIFMPQRLYAYPFAETEMS
jgi:hypothetical protein